MSRGDAPLSRLLGRSVAWSTLDVAVGRLGQFAVGVVVARIVAPKDFGVFAIALVVHAVVINVSELGVSSALIRDDPAHTKRTAPTVAMISFATSTILAILMAALSPLLATALGSPKAATPIAVMALTLPLAGLTAVPSALLRRDFRMDRVFYADVANLVVTSVAVVLMALAGWGALALAWSWVAGQLATTVFLLSYRAGRFWPGWQRSEARRLLAFGLPLAGANILAFLVLNVDYIIVGRILGPEALGMYVLAFNISGWPLNIFGAVIRSVSVPSFARLRHEGEVVSEHFVRALGLIAGVTLPICFVVGALARPAVDLIYGKRWSEAAAALVGLSVLGAGRILLELSGDYIVSLGRTRPLLAAQVIWLTVLATTLVLVTPGHGIRGVGAAQAFVAVAIMGPVYAVLLRRTGGVSLRAAARALTAPVLWGLLAAGAAHAVATNIANDLLACLAGGALGMAIAAVPYAGRIKRLISALLSARRVGGQSPATAANAADTVAPA